MVPYTSSYFLTNRFDVSQQNGGGWNVYNPQQDPNIRSTVYSGEFPHLLNFHGDSNEAPLFHRIFDYVEVPSRYTGPQTYLNPDRFTASNVNAVHQVTQAFAPPFDFVSNYRVPGKININTITDPRIWEALHGAYFSQLPFNTWLNDRTENPYGALNAINRVPTGTMVKNPADAGLYRRPESGNIPYLDFEPSPDPRNATRRNAFY